MPKNCNAKKHCVVIQHVAYLFCLNKKMRFNKYLSKNYGYAHLNFKRPFFAVVVASSGKTRRGTEESEKQDMTVV